jgi:hypothetical protein
MQSLVHAISFMQSLVHAICLTVAAGKAAELGATPAFMHSLVHAISFMYTRFVDDDLDPVSRGHADMQMIRVSVML